MKNNDEDLAVFSKVIIATAEEFGGSVSDDNLELKFNALREYSLDKIKKAGTWIIKNREQTFPAVPRTQEFINAIEIQEGNNISLNTQAEIQADLVLRHVKYYSPHAPKVLFEDKITRYLMRDRWTVKQMAATTLEKDNKWFRKEFIEAYQAYSEGVKINGAGFLDAPGELKQLEAPELLELSSGLFREV